MARIRANLNSFSTGFVSQKVRGNVDFEGYNNSLSECTNFLVQHTGGLFKRGGTEYISNTRDNNKVKMIPFELSSDTVYMCEFGDLPDSEQTTSQTSYIRFYNMDGLIESAEIKHNYFSLEEFLEASIYVHENVLTIIMIDKIHGISLKKDSVSEFEISPKIKFTYPPLTPTNFDSDKTVLLSKGSTDTTFDVEFKDPSNLFYPSDSGEVFSVNGILDDDEDTIVTVSFRIGTISSETYQATLTWEDSLNTQSKPIIEDSREFTEWRISQLTSKRLELAELTKIGVAMYEGRFFIAVGNAVYGSSLKRNDILDFMPGTADDDGLAFFLADMQADDIIWCVGKAKLFLATNSSLFMSGAATINDSYVSPSNFRPRMFQKLGSSRLKPIVAGDAIFFVDNAGRNVYEIVLSADTGMYQANDLSLLGEDLTHSGIVAHTWQQRPIKTYWCVTNDGFLCSLTYLKNNGIMAWAKHEIAGKEAVVEDVCTISSGTTDYLWLSVKRQITNADGEQEIVRTIEYMHNIYDPLSQEEFKQFFVDCGIQKELKHTIKSVQLGNNYSLTIGSAIRRSEQNLEETVMFSLMGGEIEGNHGQNPFLSFSADGAPNVFIAKNFSKSESKYKCDLFTLFEMESSITSGKIDPEGYENTYKYDVDVGIFIRVATIKRVDTGRQTKIYCETSQLQEEDVILLLGSKLTSSEKSIDYTLSNQQKLKVSSRENDSFNLGAEGLINVDTTGSPEGASGGEIYKLIARVSLEKLLSWTQRTGLSTSKTYYAITYGNNTFVAVGTNGALATSTDGITWTQRTGLAVSKTYYAMTYGNNMFVAVGLSGALVTSADGITWTERAGLSTETAYYAMTYGNNMFVAVGLVGALATSADGITWTERAGLSTAKIYRSIVYANGIFVAVGRGTSQDDCACSTSTDGITWTERTGLSRDVYYYGITYGKNMFVAVGSSGALVTSADSITWTQRTGLTKTYYAITYVNDVFVAVGESGALATSADGITWTELTMPSTSAYYAMTYGNNMFVAVGLSGNLATSDDGVTSSFTSGINDKIVVTGKVEDDKGDVYINKVYGTTQLNKKRYKKKTVTYDLSTDESTVTLYDYSASPSETTVDVPLDASGYGIYDVERKNNGNMYEYFDVMDGLDHLFEQEVSVCANGNSLKNQTVIALDNGSYGFRLDNKCMYCVAGLPFEARIKTVPFSGGNLLGSSVGVVGQQIHAVFHLYYSLGGSYGTDEINVYPFSYDVNVTFNTSKNLFTGIKKLPLINSQNIYDRCVYLEHSEPLSFNVLSITEEIGVTDA